MSDTVVAPARTRRPRPEGALRVIAKAGPRPQDTSRTDAALGKLQTQFDAWQRQLIDDAAIYYRLYRRHVWVRSIVDKTAQAISADMPVLKRVADDKAADTHDARAQAIMTLVKGMFGTVSFKRGIRQLSIDLLVNANSYYRIQRVDLTLDPADGAAVEAVATALQRVDFRMCAPRLDTDGDRIGYSYFRKGRFDVVAEPWPLEDVLMVQTDAMRDGGVGLSLLEALDNTLALDDAAIKYNLGFMRNGTKAGDVYNFDDKQMTPEAIEREREYIEDEHTNPEDAHKPMFLAGAIKLLKDGSQGKDDMGWLEGRKWNREETAAGYQFPLSLLTNDKGGLGHAGKAEDMDAWNEDVIAPWQEFIYAEISRQWLAGVLSIEDYYLAPPKNAAVKLEHIQMAQGMVGAGATGNEARGVMHLDEMDGLDKPLYLDKRVPVVGIPGDPESVIYTSTGAVSGDIQDPQETNPDPAPIVAAPGAGTPIGARNTGNRAQNTGRAPRSTGRTSVQKAGTVGDERGGDDADSTDDTTD